MYMCTHPDLSTLQFTFTWISLHICLHASQNTPMGENQAAEQISANLTEVLVAPTSPSPAWNIAVGHERSCLSLPCRLPKEQQCLGSHKLSSSSARLTEHKLFSKQNDLFTFLCGIWIKYRLAFHFPMFALHTFLWCSLPLIQKGPSSGKGPQPLDIKLQVKLSWLFSQKWFQRSSLAEVSQMANPDFSSPPSPRSDPQFYCIHLLPL